MLWSRCQWRPRRGGRRLSTIGRRAVALSRLRRPLGCPGSSAPRTQPLPPLRRTLVKAGQTREDRGARRRWPYGPEDVGSECGVDRCTLCRHADGGGLNLDRGATGTRLAAGIRHRADAGSEPGAPVRRMARRGRPARGGRTIRRAQQARCAGRVVHHVRTSSSTTRAGCSPGRSGIRSSRARSWRFTLGPGQGGTTLRQWVQLGPGRSGLASPSTRCRTRSRRSSSSGCGNSRGR